MPDTQETQTSPEATRDTQKSNGVRPAHEIELELSAAAFYWAITLVDQGEVKGVEEARVRHELARRFRKQYDPNPARKLLTEGVSMEEAFRGEIAVYRVGVSKSEAKHLLDVINATFKKGTSGAIGRQLIETYDEIQKNL